MSTDTDTDTDDLDLSILDDGDDLDFLDDDGENFPGEKLPRVLSAFQQRAKTEQDRFADVTDSEYWVCLCFQSREQAEAFAAGAKLPAGEKYVDGRKFARRLGIELPPEPEIRRTRSANKGLVDLV